MYMHTCTYVYMIHIVHVNEIKDNGHVKVYAPIIIFCQDDQNTCTCTMLEVIKNCLNTSKLLVLSG